ncbi:bifunctional DNA-formamidopyrimidine glycosylase/DNA-(apurinic or apyrimidinic site) lyase [Hoyosella rhizosphaerae]|uniref:Formamidopyrimidine-DNA glycosylase n=1 Tax=Hoyosella rhizosphaerae TaxID=1755582 RepID=A0A916TYC8_9ACTN|nr:bifunctional DNA-formamidopyrimidine glycosylase/DNA-(apurinic or apyrimidinic site) lyase [Hoyosella rhizosphaerae]MBN4927311.1 bifunctional DNA-formamidopyrimidine glycosylase/DNA-(apurinic or apyrimidinic site) lyase [Hoyosella rhizosphaerae]GGC52273.1 formamidopyrimidine-DNA glycosylase [Hoyosella rhizosphaerae]
MPELPEVEVVRLGLERHILASTINHVAVLHPRAVRRHVPGARDIETRLQGRQFVAAHRRGKYLWLELDSPSGAGEESVLVHLGMSGQMLVQPPNVAREAHARIVVSLANGMELRFVDQRTFGGWMMADLVPSHGGAIVPVPITHIARDPLDPLCDIDQVVEVMRGKTSEVKRLLLDQTVVSGIGNIYADEALWRVGMHGARIAQTQSRPKLRRLIHAAADVMTEALAQGGTTFDALYVNVNGQSGYFSRSLNAYGRENEPCVRCGAVMRRESFMNRSSFYCPRCQPRPRRTSNAAPA